MKIKYILAISLTFAFCLPAWAAVKKAASSGSLLEPFLILRAYPEKKDALSRDINRLLEQGADPNVSACSDGVVVSPLRLAAQVGDRELVKLLLAKGADPNDEGNEQLARTLVRTGKIELFDLLLAHGWKFHPNEATSSLDYGPTYPLSEAIREEQPPMVRYLLKLGADPMLRDASGRNAFDEWRELATSCPSLRQDEKKERAEAYREIGEILKNYVEQHEKSRK